MGRRSADKVPGTVPGCSAEGRTEEEALKESKVVCKLWLEEYYDLYEAYAGQKRTVDNFNMTH